MTNSQKLLLFDMDGTLVSGNDFLARYQVFLGEQFSEFFGRPIEINFSGLHGGTERGNIRILLRKQGINPSNEQLNEFFYIAGRNYVASDKDAKLLPYVAETISRLSKRFLLGLSTGNPEVIARKKLRIVGLDDYFKFGGFGNESEDRRELVNLALSRARDYGWDGNLNDTYVIGDTTKDVESGKSAGIKTVAIMTGSESREQLKGSNPNHIIENLSELETILV